MARPPDTQPKVSLFWLFILLNIVHVRSDLMSQISDENGPFSLDHTYISEIRNLPDYSIKYSDKQGLLFLGPSIIHPGAFMLMTHGNAGYHCMTWIESSPGLNQDVKISHFSTHSNCSEMESRQISFRKHGFLGAGTMDIDITDLPNPTCDSKHMSIKSSFLFPEPPGLPILVCSNGSIHVAWDFFKAVGSEDCVEVYWRPIQIPCGLIHKRSLLSLSCEIELLPSQQHGRSVQVTLHHKGEIRLMSDEFIKTVVCESICEIPIGSSSELTVTCPDGSEYHFNMDKSSLDKCVRTTIPGVREANLFLCKGSHRPWLSIVFFFWLIGGIYLLRFAILFVTLFIEALNRCTVKMKNFGKSKGISCSECGGKVMLTSHLSYHASCLEGECPYCTKRIGKKHLKDHVESCAQYIQYLLTGTTDVDIESTLVYQISKKIKERIFTSYWIKGFNIILIFTMFCLILLPSAEGLGENVRPNMFTEYKKALTHYIDTIPVDEQDTSYNIELQSEINLCGLHCLHHPLQCMCPAKEFSMNATNKLASSFTKYLATERRTESAELHSELEEKEKRTFLERIRKLRMDNTAKGVVMRSDVGKLMTNYLDLSARQMQQMRTVMTGHQDEDKLLALPQLSRLLTSWGLVEYDAHIAPTYSSGNLAISMESFKKEQSRVFVKGTVVGKMKLEDKTGIMWKITNPDSDETKTLSVQLVNSAQVYKLNLRYFTASRGISTWFKGACVGDCPNKCGCKKTTCYKKIYEYDRSWGCNPGWCFNFNGGCSCCAADLSSGLRKAVLGVYEVKYSHTEIIMCFNSGHDAGTCRVMKDNEQFSTGGYHITVSKAYNQESKINSAIGLLWLNKNENFAQHKHPTQILINPETCESNCVHGEIGDYKAWDLETAIGLEGEKTLGDFLDDSVINKIETFAIKSSRLHRKWKSKSNQPTPSPASESETMSKIQITTTGHVDSSTSGQSEGQTNTSNDSFTQTLTSTTEHDPDQDAVIFRHKRWVSSDRGDFIDRLFLEGILGENDFVVFTAIDILGHYNFIIKIHDNPTLQVLTSANSLSEREHVEELKYICDLWRYTQTLESSRSNYFNLSVNFGVFSCSPITTSPFSQGDWIGKMLSRKQKIKNKNPNPITSSPPLNATDLPPHPVVTERHLTPILTNESTILTGASKPSTVRRKANRRKRPTVNPVTSKKVVTETSTADIKHLTSTKATTAPSSTTIKSISTTTSKPSSTNPTTGKKFEGVEEADYDYDEDKDYDASQAAMLTPRMKVENNLVTKEEFESFKRDTEAKQSQLEQKMDHVRYLAKQMMDIFSDIQDASQDSKRLRRFNTNSEISDMIYAAKVVMLQNYGNYTDNFEEFVTSYNDIFEDISSMVKSNNYYQSDNFDRLVNSGIIFFLTHGGMMNTQFPVNGLRDLKANLTLASGLTRKRRFIKVKEEPLEDCEDILLTNMWEELYSWAQNRYTIPDSDLDSTRIQHGNIGTTAGRRKRSIESENLMEHESHGNNRKPIEEMSWTGVTTKHTCHVGSWPDCDFSDLHLDITNLFEDLNRTSKHLVEDYVLRKLYMEPKAKSGILSVHPKENSGMVDFTIQATNLIFIKKEVEVSVGEFEVKHCQGCYGCNSGFSCIVEIELKTPDKVSLHFDSDSYFVVIDETGYNVQKQNDVQLISVKGSTPIKELNTTLCIIESRKKVLGFKSLKCSKMNLKLDEPIHRLIKRETLINLKPTDSSVPLCSGWGFFSCTWSNLKNIVVNTWCWLASGFGWVRIFLIVLAVIVCLLIFIKIVLCSNAIRKKEAPSKVMSPRQMIKMAESAKQKFNQRMESKPLGVWLREALGVDTSLDEDIPLLEVGKTD